MMYRTRQHTYQPPSGQWLTHPALFLTLLGLSTAIGCTPPEDVEESLPLKSAQKIAATFPIQDDFSTASSRWLLSGSAKITGGVLELTTATTYVGGAAIYNDALSSSRGVSVVFDYYAGGGSGADGFTFFLVDGATTSPTVGAYGASLGYMYGVDASNPPGVKNAYLGIGFDEYGNFLNTTVFHDGVGPSLYPDRISLRGSATITNSNQTHDEYDYMSGSAVDVSSYGGVDGGTRKVNILLTANQRVTLRMSWDNGTTWKTLLSDFDFGTPNAAKGYSLPSTLKFGFSASCGSLTNKHTIDNLYVTEPSDVAVAFTSTPTGTLVVGDTASYQFTVTNKGPNSEGTGTMALTLPTALNAATWSYTSNGGDSGSGTGSFTSRALDLSVNETATFSVSGTIPSSAALGTATTTIQYTHGAGFGDPNPTDQAATSAFTIGNSAPVAVADAYSTNTNTTLTVSAPGVLGNDTDANNHSLSAYLSVQPTYGTVSLSSNGGFTYIPPPGYYGSDSFKYYVNDGFTNSSAITVSLTINQVNTAPTLAALSDITVAEDSAPSSVTLTISDAQTAASSLTVTAYSSNESVLPNTNLVLGGSGGSRTLTLTPVPNASGMADVSVNVSDGSLTTTRVFKYTVTAVNDAPVINAIANVSTSEDTATSAIAVGISDVETAASSLSFSATSSNQTLVPNANLVLGGSGSSRTLVATPAANQSGTSTITVTVSDGQLTGSASFTLTVTAVNDAPVINAIANVSTPEDTATSAIALTLSDVETAATSLTLTATSSNQTLVLNANLVLGGSGSSRTLTATPASNASGTSTITVSVSDGQLTGSASFTLTVTAVNDAPVINAIANVSTPEDTATSAISVGISDLETAAASLTLSASSSNQSVVPNSGLILGGSGSSRTLVATPAPGSAGSTTLTVTVSDGQLTGSTSFTLTVAAVNDAPVLDPISDVTTPEDTATPFLPLSLSDAETANSALDIRATSDNSALLPEDNISIIPIGNQINLILTPVPNMNGSATVTVTVSDGQNFVSRAFTCTVTPVNDAPHIIGLADLLIEEDTSMGPLNLTVYDFETANEALSLSVSSSDTTLFPSSGLELVQGISTPTLTLTPAPNASGSAEITLTVSDGEASSSTTFLMRVDPVNDLPSLSLPADQTLQENEQTAPLPFHIEDLEQAAEMLEVSATCSNTDLVPPEGLILSGSSTDRTLQLIPAASAHGTCTITLTVSDGEGSTQGSFLLTVLSVNDRPLAQGEHFTLEEDTALELPAPGLLSNDSDIDQDSLTVSLQMPPAHGALNLSADGSFSYTPDADFAGDDAFQYRVSDGLLESETVEVLLTLQPVNDAPRPQDDAYTVPEGRALEQSAPGVLANDLEADGEALSTTLETAPAHGTAELSPQGALRYTPEPGYIGVDSLVYRATDASGLSTLATVTLNVQMRDQDADDVPDDLDNCASLANSEQLDTDGDLQGDACDLDDDNDLSLDLDEASVELDPLNPDSDGDSILDGEELGDPSTPADTDQDGQLDALDDDSDDDNVSDQEEAGDSDPQTPALDTDSDGTPDFQDLDSDEDGRSDLDDNCRLIANPEQSNLDGDSQGDACDDDLDGDDIPNSDDNCEDIPNPAQADLDADGAGDDCDTDDDDDSVADDRDNCPTTSNADQANLDADLQGDVCDADDDGDDILDSEDSCPAMNNPEQTDQDGDGLGDGCDPDQDGDNIPDTEDTCPEASDAEQHDFDQDGLGDLCDLDADGDDIPDGEDTCLLLANPGQEDSDEDGLGDPCDPDVDDDGIPNDADNCPSQANPDQADSDGDGAGDPCDASVDQDLDGVLDSEDNCPTATNGDQADSDGDALGDPCDVEPYSDYVVEGGGCSLAATGTSSGMGAVSLMSLGALLTLSMRRRRGHSGWKRMVALIATALLPAFSGQAQTSTNAANIEHWLPSAGGPEQFIGAQGADILEPQTQSFGLTTHFAYRPLVFRSQSTGDVIELVGHDLSMSLLAATALGKRFQLGLALPVTLSQAKGETGDATLTPLSGQTSGDIRFQGTWRSLRFSGRPFSLALSTVLTLPSGDETALRGELGPTLEPRIVLERRLGEHFRLGLNAGYWFRPRTELYGMALGNEMHVASALAWTHSPGGLSLLTEVSGRGSADPSLPRNTSNTAFELLAAARFRPFEDGLLTLGIGAPLGRGYGVPSFRVLAGLTFLMGPSTRARTSSVLLEEPVMPKEPEAPEAPCSGPGRRCAQSDTDQDGICDAQDTCTDTAEDQDGFQDSDGCPDPDNDGDGLLDAQDACPTRAEDLDQLEDTDGCPELDFDADGVPDSTDDCPAFQEELNGIQDWDGCPDDDADRDGIPDPLDACRTQPETYNSVEDANGCPDQDPAGSDPWVAVAPDRLVLSEKIGFESGKAILLAKSLPILERVARVMTDHPELKVLKISGHTDARGNPDQNKLLSEQRAEAVRTNLIAQGIDATRLYVEGLGATRPIASNDTREGREQNRRVVLKIQERIPRSRVP